LTTGNDRGRTLAAKTIAAALDGSHGEHLDSFTAEIDGREVEIDFDPEDIARWRALRRDERVVAIKAKIDNALRP
jgi:hypothetical protein